MDTKRSLWIPKKTIKNKTFIRTNKKQKNIPAPGPDGQSHSQNDDDDPDPECPTIRKPARRNTFQKQKRKPDPPTVTVLFIDQTPGGELA